MCLLLKKNFKIRQNNIILSFATLILLVKLIQIVISTVEFMVFFCNLCDGRVAVVSLLEWCIFLLHNVAVSLVTQSGILFVCSCKSKLIGIIFYEMPCSGCLNFFRVVSLVTIIIILFIYSFLYFFVGWWGGGGWGRFNCVRVLSAYLSVFSVAL